MQLHEHILCLITKLWNKLPCPLSSGGITQSAHAQYC